MNLIIKTLILISILLLSCSRVENNSLTGQISYHKHFALTNKAVVTIQLVDISKQDVKAKVFAEKVITNPGQLPLNFNVQYNPNEILSGSTYSLNVKVEDNGRLLFITDKTYPVINNDVTENIILNVVPANVVQQDNSGDTKLNTPKGIDAHVNNMRLVTGNWEMGDASSIIEAYYAEDELKLIIEQMDMGDYGASEYKYYFKDGYLFYHEQNGKRTTPNSTEAANVNVILLFNSEGDLVASSKKVNFKQTELHDIEAPGVLKHCELIVQVANQNFQQNL